MRLRYFLGMVATLSLTSCSVDVDVYPTSKLIVSTTSNLANGKYMLVNSDQTVINVTQQPIELINGTYELIYVASEDDICSITGYDYGSLDYSKARIAYKRNVMNASDLGSVEYDHQTVTVPGAGRVIVIPRVLTQEYTVQWTVTAEQEAALKEKPKGGTMGNLPSSFSLKTGEAASSGNLQVNFSFTTETLSSGDVRRTAKVILPIMDKLPEKFYLRTSESTKNRDFTLDNTTITIK